MKNMNDFCLKMRAKMKSQRIPMTEEAEITKPMLVEFCTCASI